MADITTLRNTYFIQSGDADPPSEPMPQTFEDSRVTPLIDGEAYFSELAAVLNTVGTGATPEENEGQFIYITGWYLGLLGGKVTPAQGSGDPEDEDAGSDDGSLGPFIGDFKPFALDGRGGTNILIDLLKNKAQAGVDVRVMGWVHMGIVGGYDKVQKALPNIHDYNVATIETIHNLRQEPAMAKKCLLNVLGHVAGGAHAKMVIISTGATAIGFTGGLDLVENRHASEMHVADSWHDVQAKVEGPAVQALYDYFKDIWNEIISLPQVNSLRPFKVGSNLVPIMVSGTDTVPGVSISLPPAGNHHVQSLRTIPQYNYHWYNLSAIDVDGLSFAPDGLFEVRLAWRKAILAAENYIYVEDQSFWSIEIMSWINEAIQNHPNLKVILVGGQSDPDDPILPRFNLVALQDGLLAGLDSTQIDRIGVFVRKIVIHSKTTLIDDHWAIIGSANFTRRSLYTDIEHSVAVLDEDDQLVRDYRVNLWGGHFNLPPSERSVLNNLDHALNVWISAWGTPGSGVTLPSHLGTVTLPPPAIALKSNEKQTYDRFNDPDSREKWRACP